VGFATMGHLCLDEGSAGMSEGAFSQLWLDEVPKFGFID
jgi:hypothetical protein